MCHRALQELCSTGSRHPYHDGDKTYTDVDGRTATSKVCMAHSCMKSETSGAFGAAALEVGIGRGVLETTLFSQIGFTKRCRRVMKGRQALKRL